MSNTRIEVPIHALDDMRAELSLLREALERIAEVEQSHRYEMFDEANPVMTARNDLRSCGDLARDAVSALAKADGK